jgi:hypothetical protein
MELTVYVEEETDTATGNQMFMDFDLKNIRVWGRP